VESHEKELEDLLQLLQKLEAKIQKVADVVGLEAPILGEKENPKNFNALERIKRSDSTVIDEMERSAELLPDMTPFQFMLSYLKKMGKEKLESIPLGKRSGKSSDINGVALFYREKKNLEGIHLMFYDYDSGNVEHVNDVTWVFSKVRCEEGEQLRIPLEGLAAFRDFRIIDRIARARIVTELNVPFDTREGRKVKSPNQKVAMETVLDLFRQGKIPQIKTGPVYEMLVTKNLAAWELDLHDYLEEYKIHKNPEALLAKIDSLIQRFKIEARDPLGRKKIDTKDLDVIGYIFLSKPNETFPMLAG